MHLYQPVTRSRGFSLVEFMVAITISLIILLALSIAWQAGYKTQKTQTDASRLNESLQFAISLLSREIRQAGLINTVNASKNESNFCSDTSTGGTVSGANDPATIDPTAAGTNFSGATVTILNKSDAIRVRYYGEDTSTGTDATSDCLGNVVAAGQLVEDTLYVAADPNNNNEPALWCHTSNPTSAGAPTQPLVAEIESLQLLYGYDTTQDGIVDMYLPWQPYTPNNNQLTSPDNILSVKISVLARSPNAVSVDATQKTYYHFGKTYIDPTGGSAPGTIFVAPNDRRLRPNQPLSTEIAIRNFANCS